MNVTEKTIFDNARRLHAEATSKLNAVGMDLFDVLSGRKQETVERLAFAQQKADGFRSLIRTLECLFPNLPFHVATEAKPGHPAKPLPPVHEPTSTNDTEYLTVEEATALFGVSYNTLYQWHKAGDVAQQTRGKKAVYSRADLEIRVARMRKGKTIAHR